MKKWLFKSCKLLLCSIIFGAMLMMQCSTVKAAEMVDLPYIVIDSYELTKEKVIPGEDFTLTMKLRNSSKSATAYNVVVNVTNPSGVLPIYGKVSQTLVDNIKPGEVVEVSFDYTSVAELFGECLDFYVSVSGTTYTNVVLRVPMGVDSPFTILASGIPTQMYAEEISSAYVSFKVLGDENVRNVYLEMQVDDEIIVKSSIGTLTPGVTRTQNLSPMISTPGIYEAKLILYYDDATEQTQSIVIGTSSLNVTEKLESSDSNQEPVTPNTPPQEEEQINKSILMGAGGIIVLLVLAIAVWFVRKRR